jgi:hypothetical protein
LLLIEHKLIKEGAVASKEEILEAIKGLGVEHFPISDSWSDAKTLIVLLAKNPDDKWYLSRLDEEATRDTVWKMVQQLKTGSIRI